MKSINGRHWLFASTLVAAALSVVSSGQARSASGQALPPEWAADRWQASDLGPSDARYGAVRELGVPITMSDGVVLSADISYPADPATGKRAGGNFPVLLTQTPYLNMKPDSGDYFVDRGYIYVSAHVRGTTVSGGAFGFFSQRDAEDGADLVRWVANKLPGSSGVVGLHGGSYMGITQFFTLAALGPGSPVKALEANCMGAEFYRETYFASGVPTQTLNFQRVIQGSMGKATGAYGAAMAKEVERGGERAYFGRFWQQRTIGALVPQIVRTGVPVMLWSSDGDIYAQSSLELYAYLQNAAAGGRPFGPMSRTASASNRYQIFMSQGGHCANEDPRVQLAWFDTWLKGIPTGLDRTNSTMHLHELVSEAWIGGTRYPATDRYTKLYLAPKGTLALTSGLAKGRDAMAWAQPAPTSRLIYEGPIFPRDERLAGPIAGSFVATSSRRNLMIIATLELVSPGGATKKLTSGAVLGSLAGLDRARTWYGRDNVPIRPYAAYDTDRYVAAGQVRRYDFAISPRYAFLPKGSHLRLKLTTQTPAEDCTPVLGTDPCFPTAPQKAALSGSIVSIFRGRGVESFINLPLSDAANGEGGSR